MNGEKLLTDEERIQFIEKLLKHAPGTQFEFVEPYDADEETPAGFRVTIEGCDPIDQGGFTDFRSLIDTLYLEMHL